MRNLTNLFMLLACLLFADSTKAQCTPTDGAGRTWCIEFIGTATSDGQIIFKWTARRNDGAEQKFDMDVDVRKGDTAVEKATRLETKLRTRYGTSLGVCRNGSTVCFRLKPNNAFQLAEVTAGEVTENETGEEGVRVYDPPSLIMMGIFDLKGSSVIDNGHASLQIGYEWPVVQVSTKGKTADEIETELVEAFNKAYKNTKLKAEKKEKHIEIPFIRCDEGGIMGGATDYGLCFHVGLIPMDAVYTALEEDGMAISWWMYAVVILIALIILYLFNKRKK